MYIHIHLPFQPADLRGRDDTNEGNTTNYDCNSIAIPPSIGVTPSKECLKDLVGFNIFPTNLRYSKALQHVT